ncbi:hypothetical protein COX86_01865 [Candidatus Micrarchaeota archaeon CG_4_10_14_0_2_um_filter_60_11]|nr:MAG: hypothetical protein AUJ16_03240 [Candidatus Micrarchaeota archaeon CG1_02_60_51]PIN96246.1 MAG: hypothetical protein COU39_02145 [Candidatus Micrarchaeota archaeon CG10_big_fil_rev_8_21_14_0_10_60_32]PIO02267.1 MAG: hypothetical protein COT58_00980 [Candidatus Micrarchaeota archaeon CG09_land_8_20_14_0_10_60_16]PIY91612.1 MAG: hypothetical protein COY71_02255 [Candidatus Micrarchaeota archaeon CG_4_10_14_0_8_um_filter_60_7]PIZ91016.1 MAG: hypothetical protein COX86_01865 [Candidatus Mi
MNLRVTGKAFMLLVSLALIAYGTSNYINAWLGAEQSIFNEAWKLIAIAVGASLLTGYAYPSVRGIKRGDQLIAFLHRNANAGGQQLSFMESVFVTALEDGRQGAKIKVRLANGLSAEGVVTGYAGTLTPPTIQITESEVKVQHRVD